MSNINLEKEFQNYSNMMFSEMGGNEYYNNKTEYRGLLYKFINHKKEDLKNKLNELKIKELNKFRKEKNEEVGGELPIRLVDLFRKYKSNKGGIKHKNRKSELDIFCELNEIKEKFTENQIKSFKNRQKRYNNTTNYQYFYSLYEKMIRELSMNNTSINNTSINKFIENYNDFKNNEEHKNGFKKWVHEHEETLKYRKKIRENQERKNKERENKEREREHIRYYYEDNRKHTISYWDLYFRIIKESSRGTLRHIGANGVKTEILHKNPRADFEGVRISEEEYREKIKRERENI
jgi:hypothetical protein